MNVTGEFRYLKPSVCPSLYRNGEVLTRRDPDGSDAGTSGVDTEEHPMPIHDARLLTGTSRRTLERNGFELLAHPLARRCSRRLRAPPVWSRSTTTFAPRPVNPTSSASQGGSRYKGRPKWCTATTR